MPQIHEDYATFLNIPSWVPLSGTTALVVDASAFSRGTFAFYAEGLISRRAILRLINLSGLEDPDVFAFGDLAPLRDDETRNPMQGGLIRVLRRGQVIEWGSPLSERLLQPGRWQPATETPPPLHGRFLAFQTKEDVVIQIIARPDPRTLQQIAAAVMDIEDDDVWVLAPEPRPERLESCGRRVRSVIAVLDRTLDEPRAQTLIFADLRGVGRWVQWLLIDGELFDPLPFIDGLQLVYCEGWSLVIQGGVRTANKTSYECNMASSSLSSCAITDEITPTSSPRSPWIDEGSESEPDGEPDSEGTTDAGPSGEQGPRGPPPPRPVQTDRSRSPRRHGHTQEVHGDDAETKAEPQHPRRHLALADYLPPVSFKLTVKGLICGTALNL